MALQGTLDTFALADLVRLMATTTKTGELTIEDEGQAVAGRLWFVDGDLVAGEPGDAEDALFALLRLPGGSFDFTPEAGPAGVSIEARDALDVLATAEARVEAWRPVEALVPHPDVVVRLREELADDEVTVDRDTWRQIRAVAVGTTARDLAAALALDEAEAALAVKALADRGLVEVDDDIAVADSAVAEPVALVVVAPPADDLAAEPILDEHPTTDQFDDEEPPAEAAGDAAPESVVAGPDDAAGWGAGWDLTPVPGDPFAPLPPAEPGGSLAVDMDSHLGGAVDDHRYLGGEASTLPEALPEPAFAPALVPDLDDAEAEDFADREIEEAEDDEVDVEILAAEAATAPPAEPTIGGSEEDLALQLEALSPAAARAVAAAASAAAEEEGNDGDAGRRVLRRIISSGRG